HVILNISVSITHLFLCLNHHIVCIPVVVVVD
ncbi:hypothetical protein CISIN_1g0430192mg, partial [Citrus sinensis]